MDTSQLLLDLLQSARARRANLIEEIAAKESRTLEPGQYTAFWVKYASNGDGIVLHNGKKYYTNVNGTTSIPRGAPVILTVTAKKLFSSW